MAKGDAVPVLEKITIKMLGDFSVTADGRTAAESGAKLTKPWQLFCYLVLNRGKVTPAVTLLQELWGGDDLTDPANVLKNTVYALRRELSGAAKPAESPILFRAGGYCINERIKWCVDVERFAQLCDRAARCDKSPAVRSEHWRRAEAAFRGDLLPQLAGEVWVMRAARAYVQRYLACVKSLCACCAEDGDYGLMLDAATRAAVRSPLDEEVLLWQFRAMDAMHMQRAAVITYNKAARYFEEEMGRPLCGEIQRIYRNAAQAVNKTEQDFATIKDELAGAVNGERGQHGAYYCNYEVFKRMYIMVARTAQRSRQVVGLMLVTAQGADGGAPDGAVLAAAMDDLKLAISGTLRKSDTFAKYSKNQFALLLPMAGAGNLAAAEGRLLSAYESARTQPDVRLEFRHTILEDV